MSFRKICLLFMLCLAAIITSGCVTQTEVNYGYGMDFTETNN